ncbi:MAG: copper-binding protein [Acidobacteriota bacterium]|nr:MAG: copper-binding protein [Acidobacteriota bacterium]
MCCLLLAGAFIHHTAIEGLTRAQVERYELRGVVVSVDKEKNRATIRHEAVKGYMDAMTMPFPIKDKAALEELRPGDQITATLVVTADGASWLENIKFTARGPADSAEAKKAGDPDKPYWLMGSPGNKNATPPTVTRFDDPSGQYTCSMHLNIRSNTPGKCPRCGMDLISVEPKIPEEFHLKFDVTPGVPEPNQKITIHLSVLNPRNGDLVRQFALMHDRLFHLFLVSQDMADFQHIHPQQVEDGSFIIETALRRPGLYKVYADFYPLEGAPQMLQKHLATAGWQGDVVGELASLKPDMKMVKTVSGQLVTQENADRLGAVYSALDAKPTGDLVVELALDPSPLISGRINTLKYRLTDAKTGQAVTDLIPYLSAWGHMLILSEDLTQPVHAHPEEQVDLEKSIGEQRGGPDLSFDAFFPAPGNYRIWAQFLRGRQVYTATFDVKVERL